MNKNKGLLHEQWAIQMINQWQTSPRTRQWLMQLMDMDEGRFKNQVIDVHAQPASKKNGKTDLIITVHAKNETKQWNVSAKVMELHENIKAMSHGARWSLKQAQSNGVIVPWMKDPELNAVMMDHFQGEQQLASVDEEMQNKAKKWWMHQWEKIATLALKGDDPEDQIQWMMITQIKKDDFRGGSEDWRDFEALWEDTKWVQVEKAIKWLTKNNQVQWTCMDQLRSHSWGSVGTPWMHLQKGESLKKHEKSIQLKFNAPWILKCINDDENKG